MYLGNNYIVKIGGVNMQTLSKADCGSYTIKWLFGVPEVVEYMKNMHINVGTDIRVIYKYRDGLLIGTETKRIIIGNEVADRIQV